MVGFGTVICLWLSLTLSLCVFQQKTVYLSAFCSSVSQDGGFSVFFLFCRFKGYNLRAGRIHRENIEFEGRAGVSVNMSVLSEKFPLCVLFSPHPTEVSQLLCMCFPCSTELLYYPTGHHWLPIHWEDWGLRRTNLMSKGRRERWREVKDESEEEGGGDYAF